MTTDIKSTPLVFFGTDAFSVPPLVRLLAEGWNVVAVVTKPDSATGRGRVLTEPAVKRLAIAQNLPVFQPTRLKDIEPDLARLEAKHGIVVAYGKIIPPSSLELFSGGLINVHASLLPRYRGASPIESALLSEDTETGITLMKIDAGLDTGPTYETARLQLDGTQTRPELYEQLAEMGADLLATFLPAILRGELMSIPQNAAEATHCGHISKADGIIDWNQPAAIVERHIRAYLGWPGSRATIAGTDVTISQAHIGHGAGSPGKPFTTDDGELAVYCGQGTLIIVELKPAGKREMTGREFLLGHKLV